MAGRALLVISARLDAAAHEAVDSGRWPRKDFFELQRALDADVIDYATVEQRPSWRLLRHVAGTPAAQAWIAFSRRGRYDRIFTDGEHIGIPLALLLRLSRRAPRHVTIGHLLTTRAKRAVFRWLRPQRRMDAVLLHAGSQHRIAREELGFVPDQLALVAYQTDAGFWTAPSPDPSPAGRERGDGLAALGDAVGGNSSASAETRGGGHAALGDAAAGNSSSPTEERGDGLAVSGAVGAHSPSPALRGRGSGGGGRPLLSTAGLEYRDYPTLMDAVRGMPVQVVIAAGSHWSAHQNNAAGDFPENVEVTSLNYVALRDLYAGSTFVVVPLHEVENQAGITTILEGMAMGKAVIVSATRGQRDVVRGRLCSAEGPAGEPIGGPAAFGATGAIATDQTGLYVPPGDAAALRAAIQYLLDHPDEAAAMGAAGRRMVETHMNLDVFVERVSALLDGRTQPSPPLLAGEGAGGRGWLTHA
jgi:hypothetical protein